MQTQVQEERPRLCIWMPALWGTGEKLAMEERLTMVRRLWPGLPLRFALPGLAAAWTPDSLPAGEREMGQFMAELEAFSSSLARQGGGGQHFILTQAEQVSERSLARELADVRALGSADGAHAEASPAAEAAAFKARCQRLLAWFWLQQKTLAEIACLVHKVNSGVQGLGKGLREGDAAAAWAGADSLGADLADDAGSLAGDWRLWLEAALGVTPEGTIFVLERLPEGLDPADFTRDPGWAGELRVHGLRVSGLETTFGALVPLRSGPGAARSVRLALVEAEP